MKTKSGKKLKTRRPVRKVKSGGTLGGGRLIGQFALPLVICVCLAVCLAALGFLGYQRVAASDFFDVKKVAVVGSERSSRQSIEAIVRTETERSGVWRADLPDMKAKIEKLPFVKTVSVTRVLPGGLRVQVIERQPQAIISRAGREYLVDAEGEILAESDHREENLPFALIGWDDAKTERAWKDNLERVKTYQKMVGEWRVANVLSRVETINLTDLREPRAIIADSGKTVSIAVGRDNFGENLMRGIKAIVGKGDMFEGVNLVGNNMILAPRKQN